MNFTLNFSFFDTMSTNFLMESSENYFMGFFYLIFIFFLTLLLLFLGKNVSQKWRLELSKLAAFECGFDPLSSSRIPFSMRFFLVALLFLIFDMEVVLVFSYIFSLDISFVSMSLMSKFFCIMFSVILVIGLLHEMNEGSLEWKR